MVQARLLSAVFLLASFASGCSDDALDEGIGDLLVRPETAVDYEAELVGAPDDDIADLAEASLELFRREDDGAASIAFLRARGEDDLETMLRIMRSRGYYSAAATVEVVEPAEEGGLALARVIVEPGPAYTLVSHEIVIEHSGPVTPPSVDAAAQGSPVGQQARAAAIASAESGAVAELRSRGYPYARFLRRSGVADPAEATLEVVSILVAGPSAVLGEVRFEGSEAVPEEYLRSYLTWEPGDPFDREKLRDYQAALLGTDLFVAVTVEPPAEPPAASDEPVALPIMVRLEDRQPRTIGGSLRFETDEGPSARVTFEHRNLFGRNERLRIEAEAGLEEQSLGFAWRQPQFFRPGQALIASLSFERIRDDSFDSEEITAFLGLERILSDQWTVGGGLLAEGGNIDDGSGDETFLLGGLTGFARYDSTDSRLDPRRGARLSLEITPLGGVIGDDTAAFLTLDATGSIYRPIDSEERYVIAARGRFATVLSDDLETIPANRRLYAGGGGSVRGFAEDFVGPLDVNGDPIGGRSALVAGLEFRARFFGDIGGVIFVEGGSVSSEIFPNFEEGFQVAAGIGFRYYSVAGPIRLDFGVPLNGRDADDAFQIYFSIGQAF